MPTAELLTNFIEETFEHLWHSPDEFRALQPGDVCSVPIPFFGRVNTAKVLTVGVNPSTAELPASDWPEQLATSGLTERLLNYFEQPNAAHDHRFSTWEMALNRLGYSYRDGSAAHIDISPRATQPVSECDPYLFLEMCRYDVSRMFNLLGLLKKSRLLLMAGAVSGGCYINDFLRQVAGENEWALIGEGGVRDSGGIGYHSLLSEEAAYDAFFCSATPEDKAEGEMLLSRVAEHSERIQMLIP